MENLITKYKPKIQLWSQWIVILLLGMLFATVVMAQESDICEESGYMLTAAAKNASCAGDNTGNATVASTGCNCLYSGCTYLWSDGQTFHTAFDLAAGTYSVTVTHPNGCVLTTEVEVKEQAKFVETVLVEDATSCKEDGKGKIEVVATENAGPLTFEWSNGATTSMVEGLDKGIYELKVTNFIGCEYRETIEVDGPESFEVEVNSYDSCEGENNGRAEVLVSGGVPPYSFEWNSESNNREALATDLAPGEYSVLITDAAECTYEATVTVGETTPDISVVSDKDNVCPNEEVELSVIGSSSFELINVESTANKQVQTVFVYPTETTTYELSIETETGCITTETITIHVLDAPKPKIIAPITSICKGEQTQLIATESGGASFTWSPTTGLSNPSGNVTVASPAETTTYTLTAINSTGCTTTTEITIEVSDCLSTGIEDWEGVEGIQLFPNPNKGIFQLQLELSEPKNIQLQLYSTVGQLIERFESTGEMGRFSQSFDLSNQSMGLYYLEVQIDGERHLEKIMIY